MNRIIRRTAPLAVVAVAAAAAAVLACRSSENGRGQLAVALVDAPNPNVTEVWVNVAKVRAHEDGAGWFTVSDDTAAPKLVNLLALKDVAADLGLANLPAGTVTQIRLIVTPTGNSVTADGVQYPLVVPSGIQSGIKIQGPWQIGECAQTTVTLDFDALHSVATHSTGTGDVWILRPVIHTKKVEAVGTTCPPPPATCDATRCASGACDANGACAPGGIGTTCGAPEECLSGTCTSGACAPGGPGVPCSAPTDCASGACGQDGTCAGTGGGAGATCADNTQCNSGACTEGACEPAQQGQSCSVDTDCVTGFQCTASTCVAIVNQP